MTTGVPAPIIALARRLLFLSRWSRLTGFELVIVQGSAAKRSSLRAGGRACLDEGEGWMPDEDSNLD